MYKSVLCFVKNSVLDEPIAEASCIVADLDDW